MSMLAPTIDIEDFCLGGNDMSVLQQSQLGGPGGMLPQEILLSLIKHARLDCILSKPVSCG